MAGIGIDIGLSVRFGSQSAVMSITQTPFMIQGGDPTITGNAAQGSVLTFAAPVYNITPDEYQVRVVSGTGTLFQDWTTVTNATTFTGGAVGQTLIAQWRARKTGGNWSVTNVSAAFGPITGNQVVVAVGWNVIGTLPAGYSQLVPVSNNTTAAQQYIAGSQIANPNIAGLYFGMGQAASATAQNTTRTDPRLKGGVQGTSSGVTVVTDIPAGSAQYDIYTGHGGNITFSPGMEIWDGAAGTGTLLWTVPAAATTSAQVLDVNGTVTTEADWVAASPYGGLPKRVTASSGKITFRKSSANNMYLLTYAIVKAA